MKELKFNIIIRNVTAEQKKKLLESKIFDEKQIFFEFDGDGYPSRVRADKT